MKSKIKNLVKRTVSGALAAAIGMTTLATGASAASTGVSIGYTWNSAVNPTMYTTKYAASGGKGSLTYGEQICRFVASTNSDDWVFCVEPGASMQGSANGTWYTQYGFTEYDTFDLTDKFKADSAAYWKSLGGTDGDIAKYMGLVQYYGYSSHKNGNYFAATQCLLWELVLNYRGHTASTFGTCSDVLWNDFTYPSGGWCTKSGVEAAYNEIVANVKAHYNLPAALQKTTALAKENAKVLKFNTTNMRYEAKFTIPSAYVDKTSLTHNFSTYKSKLEALVKSKFSGTYGKDYGIETATSGTNTVYTVWSLERPFTSSSDSSIYTTSAIEMQYKSGLTERESLFCKSYYQTCLSSVKFDAVKGYTAIGSYNEPNLKVEKTYTDSSNNAITATALNTLLDKTTFVITTTFNSTKYYVVAEKNTDKNYYVFSKYTTSASEATKFKTLDNTSSKGTFVVYDLPTSASSGRTYTVTEYSVPDSERYEKLSKSVTLPSPTSDFTTNAGTGTVKLNNNEEGYDAKVGTATLNKVVQNGDGRALSSDNEGDIATLAGIYKTTRFIVGYWDGTTMRYLTNGYLSAKSAFDGDLADLNDFNDTTYKSGDGMYYAPTKLDSDHKVIFDSTRTSTDISKAYVFSAGYNYSGSDTCDYFGQVFLNLLPLNSSNVSQEIVFIEVNGAKGYGYDDAIDTSKALNLSTLGSNTNKRNISGVMKNDTGKSYTVTDINGSKYVITDGKYYPISGNKLESNKLHSDAEIVNELVNYELVLTKKDDNNTVLPGATYGLYNSSKKLLKTATTGEDGKAKFDYNLIPNTDYYVHEITAPAGYVQDTEYYKINRSNAVGNDLDNFQNSKLTDYGYEVKDKPYELKIELNKYDIINNIKIEGITFDVSLNGKNVASITTDNNGYASISNLPLGKLNGKTFENVYTVTERENEKYIMLDEDGNASREIKIVTTLDDVESKTNPVITYTADIPNTLQLVDLKVHKVDEYGNPVKGVTFDIAPTQDIVFNGKTVQKKNEKVGTIKTDAKGVASSKYIEYASDGTQGYEKVLPIYPDFEYAITETSAPSPYIVPKNNVTRFTATSDKAAAFTIPHEVTVSDDVQNGVLDVYKIDKETKQPLEGAVFEVRSAKDFSIGSKQLHKANDLICTMTTGADGHATSGDAEMYIGAEYTLTEITAPEGYTLNSDSKTFTFKFAGNEFEYTKLGVDFDNTTQQGRISVHKMGEIFTSVNMASSAYTDESGEMVVNPMTYGLVFADGDLEGAVFEITAAEDIVTADGTVRAHKGDVVATLTTNDKGYAETPLLYLGKYTVTETKAAYGYVNSSQPQSVELTYAGQEVAIRDTVNTDFDNDYQRVNVHLSKFMERDDAFGIGGNDEYTKVRFGLYTAEEIKAADGSAVPADALISEVALSENMTAEFNTKIPFGKYYVQEIATDEHYILSGEKYLVAYEYAGQDIETVDIDCGTFTNDLKRGSVKGIKVDEHDEPLSGAVFGLFRVDTTDFAAANAILTTVSDENGSFGFDNVPYGKYIVTEIAPPTGYIFSDKKYDVVIDDDGEVISLTAINESTHLSVSKKDIYGAELAGATMQIIDSEGNVFAEWVSDGTDHVVTCIPAGSYTLKETASPEGYVIATSIHFSIDMYNNVTVDNVNALSTDSEGNPTITMVDDTTKVELHKLGVVYTPVNIMFFEEFNTDDDARAVYDLLIKVGFTTEQIEQVYMDKKAGLVDQAYLETLIIGMSFDIADIAELMAMKEDGRLTKLFEVYGQYEKYVAEATATDTVPEELVDAVLQILDKDGNVIDEWTSTNEPHYIEAVLTAGQTYILHEVSAPVGYVLADDVEFTVSENGSTDKVYMSDDVTKVYITKYDITGEKELSGAKLRVTDGEGNIIDEWVSSENAHEIIGVLEACGEYILHEEISPDGYVVASDITFIVSENGEVDTVMMYDDTTKVQISKRDITNDEELAGATLQIIDANGNVVEEWVSENEPHYIEAVLTAGETYTLHETVPADGYVIANDIQFTVDEDGVVTEVTMYDDTTKVHISKRDITTDKELPGAKLVILDENGEVVEEWISTSEEHIIEGKLIVGKEYTLREITAPEGYEIANDIIFKVNEDGSVTSVVMYDEHTPTTTTTTHTTTQEVTNPHTGSAGADTALAGIAVAGMLMVIAAARKKNERD